MSTIKSSIVFYWHKYCSTTDAHGFKHIVEDGANKFRRVLWAICCLAALAFIVFYSSNRVNRYFQYDVKTTIQDCHSNSRNIPMPAITICNKNEVSLSKFDAEDTVRHLWSKVEQEDGDEGILKLKALENQPGVNTTIKLLTEYPKGSIHNFSSFDYREWLQNKGYTYDDIVLSCQYAGLKCDAFEGVNTNSLSLHYPYGQCVTINGKGENNLAATRPGSTITLRVNLDIDNYNHLRIRRFFKDYGYNNLSSMLPNSRPGLFVQIHHPLSNPEFVIGDKFPIYDGERVSIVVNKMVQVHRIKPPYQKCTDGADYNICLKTCLYNQIEKMYGYLNQNCSMIPYDPPEEFSVNNNKPFCSLYVSKKFPAIMEEAFQHCIEKDKCNHGCVEEYYQYVEKKDSVNFRYEQKNSESEVEPYTCLQDFENGNDYFGYDYYEDEIMFNSSDTVDGLDGTDGAESDGIANRTCTKIQEIKNKAKREGRAFIRVVFQDLLLEKIIYSPDYTEENLLAEVGGMMGLFAGLSILTFIQLIDFIFVALSSIRRDVKGTRAVAIDQTPQTNNSELKIREDMLYYNSE